MTSAPKVDGSGRPIWLYCGLTYRCPLACATCNNPIDLDRYQRHELSTDEWKKVLGEARELGTLQVGFCGGEPTLREDLEALVGEARRIGLYSNLITGGTVLDLARLSALKAVGLNQVRLALPSSDRATTEILCGAPALDAKLDCARAVKALGLGLVLTVPVNRYNIDQTADIIALAERLDADFVEFAEVRPTHWSAANRVRLLPTTDQVRRSQGVVAAARDRLKGQLTIYAAVSDLSAEALDSETPARPQACRNDWGTVRMSVAPDGTAWPCRDAGIIENIDFPNVRDHSLVTIWHEHAAFNGFRGQAWMKKPCTSCADRSVDFGGCRCQAYRLTGDAANADPACTLAPAHDQFLSERDKAEASLEGRTPLIYRPVDRESML